MNEAVVSMLHNLTNIFFFSLKTSVHENYVVLNIRTWWFIKSGPNYHSFIYLSLYETSCGIPVHYVIMENSLTLDGDDGKNKLFNLFLAWHSHQSMTLYFPELSMKLLYLERCFCMFSKLYPSVQVLCKCSDHVSQMFLNTKLMRHSHACPRGAGAGGDEQHPARRPPATTSLPSPACFC